MSSPLKQNASSFSGIDERLPSAVWVESRPDKVPFVFIYESHPFFGIMTFKFELFLITILDEIYQFPQNLYYIQKYERNCDVTNVIDPTTQLKFSIFIVSEQYSIVSATKTFSKLLFPFYLKILLNCWFWNFQQALFIQSNFCYVIRVFVWWTFSGTFHFQ